MADIDLTYSQQPPSAVKMKLADQDDGTHALVQQSITMTRLHQKTHAGMAWQVGHLATVNNNASMDILIVPTSKNLHLTTSIAVGGDCHGFLYRDSTASDNGTALTEENRNTNFSDGATATIYHTPTITNVGTVMNGTGQLIPGGTHGNAIGNTRDEDREIIFKTHSKNLLRITNKSGQAKTVSILIIWYES